LHPVCFLAILLNMAKQNKGKINQLHGLLDEGLLAPTWWLEEQGYSRSLLSQYVSSGWLTSPVRGVYRRPGPPLKWQYVVASLQILAGMSLHVGGRTALVHRGLGHYLKLSGQETIYLYGPEVLPAWVDKLEVPELFVVRSDAMFGERLHVRRNGQGRLAALEDKAMEPGWLTGLGLQEMTWGNWDWRLLYSSNERAMLEVLLDVPARESVQESDVLMQGLSNLRPAVVMTMLENCRSVKVKRLFLALAERHQHQWFIHLDLTRIDLGKGKRMLTPGGNLHPKYQITLPADLNDYAR
jgi:hypothetical protein